MSFQWFYWWICILLRGLRLFSHVVWLGTGQFQWSIITNDTIGTNRKWSHSNGSTGEYASHCMFRILQLVKSLPFHIPEAWKMYPIWAEPSRIGHYGEYLPTPRVNCGWSKKRKILKVTAKGKVMEKLKALWKKVIESQAIWRAQKRTLSLPRLKNIIC